MSKIILPHDFEKIVSGYLPFIANEDQKIAYLEIVNRDLQAANTELARRLHEKNGHVKRVNLAYQDAILLATWKVGGLSPSRELAKKHGVTQRRWQNAIGLLKMARIINVQTWVSTCLLYTSPSPRDRTRSRMPSSA